MNVNTKNAALVCELRQNMAENIYTTPWNPKAQARFNFLIEELGRRGFPDSRIDEVIEQGRLDALKVSTDEQLLNEVEVSLYVFTAGGESSRETFARIQVIDELSSRGVSDERISAAAEKGREAGRQQIEDWSENKS